MRTESIRSWLRNLFSSRTHWKEILALLLLMLAIVFFRSERKELNAIGPYLKQADSWWLCTGYVLTGLSVLLQAGMYKKCFAAIGLTLSWGDALVLFLKRNLLGVFLPAGSISSLAYLPSRLRRAGFTPVQVHQASGLFVFAGLLTVLLAGLPVMAYATFARGHLKAGWLGLAAVLLLVSVLLLTARSIRKKGKLFCWLEKRFPSLSSTAGALFAAPVRRRPLTGAIAYSLVVEWCGMWHVYIAMQALGIPSSFAVSAVAYITGVTMMVISPFLKGLGAVELSLVYLLQRYGYSAAPALATTVLFRVFEFWLPLAAGFVAVAWKGRQLFFRVAPSLLVFALGIINMVSAATPPLHHRLLLLRSYLPLAAIHASHLLVLLIGGSLLVTSVFLLRGLRNAWIFALVLSALSLIGHLTKALDYEEATIAALSVVVLLSTASQYRIRSSRQSMLMGIKTALFAMAAVVLFGLISFHYTGPKAFGMDFTWQQALRQSVNCFLLADDRTLQPITPFGRELVWMIRALGFITWAFLLGALIKPQVARQTASESFRQKAKWLLRQFGSSPIDYFKVSKDKLFFFCDTCTAFLAYRIAAGFAIVLEEPVCAAEHKVDALRAFDRYCRQAGLKPAYYRVDERSICRFEQLKKHKLLIGQEALLHLASFSLEGKDNKSLRNGWNSLQKKGYSTGVHPPPHTAAFLHRLKQVSDEWLKGQGRKELVFAQGLFDEQQLQEQDIITLADREGTIHAFLNIVPDYAPGECTYDLIRKTSEAPGAAMDALMIRLIDYARSQHKQLLNLGLVPMSGITEPHNAAERIMKLAAEKIRRFQHYKGLREFKEKYATLWVNKYLVYDHDFDLLQLPLALDKVMKP